MSSSVLSILWITLCLNHTDEMKSRSKNPLECPSTCIINWTPVENNDKNFFFFSFAAVFVYWRLIAPPTAQGLFTNSNLTCHIQKHLTFKKALHKNNTLFFFYLKLLLSILPLRAIAIKLEDAGWYRWTFNLIDQYQFTKTCKKASTNIRKFKKRHV